MEKYGMKDGSKYGLKKGGRGRNRTDVCRHPKLVEDDGDITNIVSKKVIKNMLGK